VALVHSRAINCKGHERKRCLLFYCAVAEFACSIFSQLSRLVGRDSNPGPLECDVEKCRAIFVILFRGGMELVAQSLGEGRNRVCNGHKHFLLHCRWHLLHPYIFICTSSHYINIVTSALAAACNSGHLVDTAHFTAFFCKQIKQNGRTDSKSHN
jgi:hypothetical protein